VYELLSEKFQLFSGVFGASDEVLGSIESGVDFEKRIVAIYQTCRTPTEIAASFDQLQLDLSAGDQEYIEDCQVCCQPILIRYAVEGIQLLSIDVSCSN
jgi:hypothetical protein